jgi:hypothetical protein
MLGGIPRDVFSVGENQCPAEKNFKLAASSKGDYPKNLVDASRVHLGLSSSWDGQLAYSA